MNNRYDVVVLGAGSGGVRAARMAAQLGKNVAVVECSALGGTCVNVGCIPKKLYSYAAHYAHDFQESRGFGWSWEEADRKKEFNPTLNWDVLKAQKTKEITRLNTVYQGLLEKAGVDIIHGKGRIDGPNTVVVETENEKKILNTDRILIATGGRPVQPDIPGKEYVLTSNEIFDLPEFPKKLLIVGGGYIASEFASIFQGLGAKVIQTYRGDQLLRGFDQDVRQFITKEMMNAGVDVRTGTEVERVNLLDDGQKQVLLSTGDIIEVDQVLYAIGREPNLEGLGFKELGGEIGPKGEIQVNEYFATSIEGIDAIGDVIGGIQLTPVALAQAMVWVDNHFGRKSNLILDMMNVPTAVFTHPEIATIGLTEEQARQRYGDVQIFKSDFRPLKHTLSGANTRALMKLMVNSADQKVIGLHIVCEGAAEIAQGFAVAMKAGLTKADFDATIGIHPSAAEELVTMRTPSA
ncbi:glutathione-disulfide reductase [Basilea psittacipulmonis]|uniref:Glutathione reductase n=1 Tax=Basilea psittacipulmonis DSM 24701 TaxID=1072685 RepID=A0A077DDR5_9BURK|nr:glutathione-disulfide reductase [Basilea psittacipulmonis]AIL33015.1 glutathione reductase [Basilea psittacipulmonis DSM 24701]